MFTVNPLINALPLLNASLQQTPLLKSKRVYERLPLLNAPSLPRSAFIRKMVTYLFKPIYVWGVEIN